MSEPIKKPRRTPESYNPKKPEIANMMKEATDTAGKQISGRDADVMVEPRIIKKAFTLVGVKGNIANIWPNFGPLLNELYKTVNDKLSLINGLVKPIRMVGFWHMDTLPSGKQEYSYFAGVEADCVNPPDGLTLKTLPESFYAVFTEQRRGTIGSPQGYAYKQWLPSSEYDGNEEIPGDFEIYNNMTDTGPECEAEILIPIKKPRRTPESYSPKKPEIAGMVKKSTGKIDMKKAYEVKTANGGSYIDGVPMLKWGEWRDNTYCGCVAALLNAIGIPVSYEEVMGLSGVCYKAIMRDDWDPSSEIPQNGLFCENNVGKALGVDVYTIQEEKKVWEQAKKSIDNGFPVLLLGGRFEGEWTLACGYTFENDEDKFFGRTYFDYKADSVPDNEVYTENKYFYSSGFPGWYPGALTRFYDRKQEAVSRKQALKVSLETCIKMFGQPPGEHHKFGYDAYDVLINGFELDDAEYKAKIRNDQYHIGSLQDARHAAYVYLNASSGLLDSENKAKLAETAKIYKTMLDNLLVAVPYEKTTSVFNGSADPAWSVAQRHELAEALKVNKDLEKQARVIVADILANWKE